MVWEFFKTCTIQFFTSFLILLISLQIEGQGQFVVEVVDSVNDYVELMKEIFDFGALKQMFSGQNSMKILLDSLHGGEFDFESSTHD